MEDNVKSGAGRDSTDSGEREGIQKDPGPYIGTVISHVKGTRMGQLKVYIPEFGSTPNNEERYLTVSYASPFYGKTFGTDTQELPDNEVTAGQSYGMWMVPPDVGSQVLCVFVNGDRDRGFWFACIYDSPSHHMVPANGRNIGGKDKTTVPKQLSAETFSNSILPVGEYSTKAKTAFDSDGLTTTPRNAHLYQASVLIAQGLDRDPIRGAISSSSMREVPSNVYGISTPGRKPNGSPDSGDVVAFRKGGHQFVMDDGAATGGQDPEGTDQLIRLRTTNGHQILMNDTENVLYIASASGAHWIEFSNNGQMNIFAQAGFNVRTKGPMNFHSDALISMQAPAIKMNASGGQKAGANGIIISSDGAISLKSLMGLTAHSDGPLSLGSVTMASIFGGAVCSVGSMGIARVNGATVMLNCGIAVPILPVAPAKKNSLMDTGLSGKNWVVQEGALESICTVAPAHEPWTTADGKRPNHQIPPSANMLGF